MEFWVEYRKSNARDGSFFSKRSRNKIQNVFQKKIWLMILVLSLSSLSCLPFKSRKSISWEDYFSQPRNEPYILELEEGRSRLLYYGAFHKVDLEDPQFMDIEERWENFQPTVAFCEGHIWPLEKSRQEAILRHGEQGLLRYLAYRDNVPMRCLDPPLYRQVKYLRKRFSPSRIKLYYILRQAAVNRMLKRDIDDLRYVHRLLKSFKAMSGFDCPPRLLIDFEYLVSKAFPELGDWRMIPPSYFHSENQGGFLARIHRRLNKFRDDTMLRNIMVAMKNEERVFALVGRSHVVMQEPALRDSIK